MLSGHRKLHQELAEIRRTGNATFDGFIDPESTGAAAPLLDSRSHALAVLAVVVPRRPDLLPAAVIALQTATRGIARVLGPDTEISGDVLPPAGHATGIGRPAPRPR